MKRNKLYKETFKSHPSYDIVSSLYKCECGFVTELLGALNSHIFNNHDKSFAEHHMSVIDFYKYYNQTESKEFQHQILKEVELRKRYNLARKKLIGDGCFYDKKLKTFDKNNNLIITEKQLLKQLNKMIIVKEN